MSPVHPAKWRFSDGWRNHCPIADFGFRVTRAGDCCGTSDDMIVVSWSAGDRVAQ